jgi:hypothetical protein
MRILLPLVASLAASVSVHAAAISLSTTSAGSRVVSATTPLTPVTGNFQIGRMSNEADFSTFVSFGTGALGSTGAFPTGVPNGTATNNTSATDFASSVVYIVYYTGTTIANSSFAGIYKSTESFAADLNNSASQTKNLTVSNFTTVVNPTMNWNFQTAEVNPAGTTGAAGTPPSNRTGIVFDLGAAIPEPTSVTLAGLAALGFISKRRRK